MSNELQTRDEFLAEANANAETLYKVKAVLRPEIEASLLRRLADTTALFEDSAKNQRVRDWLRYEADQIEERG